MKVLREITMVAQTKNGDIDVNVKMGINWATAQPIYEFHLLGHKFDRRKKGMFYSHESNVLVRIKDTNQFEKEMQELIKVINETPEIFDQEEFDNL